MFILMVYVRIHIYRYMEISDIKISVIKIIKIIHYYPISLDMKYQIKLFYNSIDIYKFYDRKNSKYLISILYISRIFSFSLTNN